MKFGILYNTDYCPQAHGSPSQYYGQILEQVQLEEELGFHAVRFGEHHYSGYSFGSPPVIAMAAAARTKRIRLGTGVALVPLNHPIRLAEEYAMLDVLSGGRARVQCQRRTYADRFEISIKALQDPIDRLSSPSKA